MTAETAKTSFGPSIAINSPASSGPAKIANPSRVLVSALAAVSCAGVSASSGRIERWVGRAIEIADVGDRREDVDDRTRQRQREGRGDEPRGDADRQIPERERAFPMDPVPQLRHERREQRRRDEQGDGRDPHLPGAARRRRRRRGSRSTARTRSGGRRRRRATHAAALDSSGPPRRCGPSLGRRMARADGGRASCNLQTRPRDAPRGPDTRNGALRAPFVCRSLRDRIRSPCHRRACRHRRASPASSRASPRRSPRWSGTARRSTPRSAARSASPWPGRRRRT